MVTPTAAVTPIITVTATVIDNPQKNTPAKFHTLDKNRHDARHPQCCVDKACLVSTVMAAIVMVIVIARYYHGVITLKSHHHG
ncbi:hypothetical protein JWG39_11555 [Desulforhopalus vacuolatus]|uniref:hypothetical protein n=1 Tax=Desulforhopalus vacuolatus TaxID=40414 RepID=UPI0019656DB9|nr:hypothetical protein [Desulforhopalus vacuolatus]MBM9520449.1 hypothetical protein [Desulforhopalus vacuolatus]